MMKEYNFFPQLKEEKTSREIQTRYCYQHHSFQKTQGVKGLWYVHKVFKIFMTTH